MIEVVHVIGLLPGLNPSEAQTFLLDRPWISSRQQLRTSLAEYLGHMRDYYNLLLTQLQSAAPKRLPVPEQLKADVQQLLVNLLREDSVESRLIQKKLAQQAQEYLIGLGFVKCGQEELAFFGTVSELAQKVQVPLKCDIEQERVRAMKQARELRLRARVEQLASQDSIQEQLRQYRENKKKQAVNMPSHIGQKEESRVVQFAQIVQLRQKDDQKRFARQALKLTNQFRVKNGLSSIQWCQVIAAVCKGHSLNMAAGKVPFEHVGFRQRVKQIRYPKGLTCQNLALNSNCGDQSPEVAVSGWIKSPGHCKNLKSATSHCGISCARSKKGVWYYTQIFTLKLN